MPWDEKVKALRWKFHNAVSLFNDPKRNGRLARDTKLARIIKACCLLRSRAEDPILKRPVNVILRKAHEFRTQSWLDTLDRDKPQFHREEVFTRFKNCMDQWNAVAPNLDEDPGAVNRRMAMEHEARTLL